MILIIWYVYKKRKRNTHNLSWKHIMFQAIAWTMLSSWFDKSKERGKAV
jgi:hypothetical protein